MKKIYKIILIVFVALLIFLLADIWSSSNWLTVNRYELDSDKVENPIRMVVLSDLHDHEFGAGNRKLIEKVRAQEPDLILMAGDFLNEDSKNSDVVCDLVRGLSEAAPVYFALGNHEVVYHQKNGVKFLQKLESAGANVLEEDYVDVEVNGTKMRLGGMYGYAFGTDGAYGENVGEAAPKETGAFLKEFENTDRLKLMMAHRPDSFIFGDAASYWDVDLVVSGHNHGGQVVVPVKGGLFGGDQGWFPKYIHGLYEKDGMDLFVTSGLGSNGQKLPRFHNRPEIAVVVLE